VPPPPFEALLLAESGEKLGEIMSLLPYYDVEPPQVRLLGPTGWAAPANRRGVYHGSWFMAPDPDARAEFEARYSEKNGESPPRIADVAYDAARIAAAAASAGGFVPAVLTRREGFTGADGRLVLQPDGTILRALAVFEVSGGGAQVVQPAALPAT
jgi:hypothetical protein